MTILQILGTGKPATLDDLRVLTAMPERAIRNEIERLRRDYPIINMQDGKGYKLEFKDLKALKDYKQQETNRARSIFYRLAGVNKQIAELENDLSNCTALPAEEYDPGENAVWEAYLTDEERAKWLGK